jgi:hypothetical protein
MSDTNLALRTSNRSMAPDTALIVGWGADADTRNDPTYPYRDRSKDDHSGEWRRPTQQEPEVELLQSVEHKRLTCCVRNLQPAIRRQRIDAPPRLSLERVQLGALAAADIAADRVNMVEGLVEDLGRGHFQISRRRWGCRPSGATTRRAS